MDGQQSMFETENSFTDEELDSLDAVSETTPKVEAQADPVKPENNSTPKQEKKEDNEDYLDILQPKAEPRTWVIGKDDYERTYVQKPLSFIAKMQWFSLVGEVLDRALSGPDGMSLGNLFGGPGGQLVPSDFNEADTFVQAIGKLLSVAPDFLVNSYCIWLAVPDYERPAVAEIMMLPPDDGGLSDEQGLEIIEVFIDQNYEALDSFFRESLGRLQRRVQTRAQEAEKKRQ